MRVLYCIPGLRISADAPWVTRYRAAGMVAAGLEVTLMLPCDKDREYFTGMPCDIVVDRPGKPSPASRFNLLNLWELALWPALIQYRAFALAEEVGADVIYLSHPEPWSLLPAVWARYRPGRRPGVSMMAANVYYHPDIQKHFPFYSRARSYINHQATTRLARRIQVVADNDHVPPFFGLKADVDCVVAREGYRDEEPSPGQRDMIRQRLGISPDRRMVLSFGAASKSKGQDLLFEAMRGMEPVVDVFVVGPTGGIYGTPEDWTRGLNEGRWSGRLHLDSRHVTDQEMRDYFTAADVIVLPYRRGIVSTSGNFRMAVECGKALLASDQHYIGEVVRIRDLGLLFPPEDVMALRLQLEEIARRPQDWFDAIGRNCRQLAHDQSWLVTGRRYRELFERVASDPEGRGVTR